MRDERSDCSSKCFGVQERQRSACASEVYLGSGSFCCSFYFFLLQTYLFFCHFLLVVVIKLYAKSLRDMAVVFGMQHSTETHLPDLSG